MHVLQKVYNFNNGDNSTKTIYKATIDQNNKNIYILPTTINQTSLKISLNPEPRQTIATNDKASHKKENIKDSIHVPIYTQDAHKLIKIHIDLKLTI